VNSLMQLGYLRVEQEETKRVLQPTTRKVASEHSWLEWPVPGFAELVWAVSKTGLANKQSCHLETVEV